MIWFLPHTPSHSPPVSKSTGDTQEDSETEIQLADGIGWQGVGEEANQTTPRKPGLPYSLGVLYTGCRPPFLYTRDGR
jgi:hypothetical protein